MIREETLLCETVITVTRQLKAVSKANPDILQMVAAIILKLKGF